MQLSRNSISLPSLGIIHRKSVYPEHGRSGLEALWTGATTWIMVGKNRSCSSLRLPEPGSLPLRTRLLISATSAAVCSRAFSSAKETPQALSTYGVVWQDLSPSRASPTVRRSHPSWRAIRASQPLRLTNSSGSLYSSLFFTDHPLPTALSLLLSMPWTSVTRVHPRPCQNFLGTAFLSSLAASNSLSPRDPLGWWTTTSIVLLLFTI